MTELKKYNAAFVEVMGVAEDQLPGLIYQAVEGWNQMLVRSAR